MTLFFIRYTSIPQTHVFRIDCAVVINYVLSPRFSTKFHSALPRRDPFRSRERIVDIRHPERCLDGFGRTTLPMAKAMWPQCRLLIASLTSF